MSTSGKKGFSSSAKAYSLRKTAQLKKRSQTGKPDASLLSPAALMALGLAGVAVAAVPDKPQSAPPMPKREADLTGATGLPDQIAEDAVSPSQTPISAELQVQLGDLIESMQAQVAPVAAELTAVGGEENLSAAPAP
jgi:hypothetical protein